jgi:hypothetical protein
MSEHSTMLSQIASEVEDWCISEECTTLDAVKLLKAEHMEMKAVLTRLALERKYGATIKRPVPPVHQ